MDREEYPFGVGEGDLSTTCCVVEDEAATSAPLTSPGPRVAEDPPERDNGPHDAGFHTADAPAAAPEDVTAAAVAPAVRPEQIVEAMIFSADCPLSLARLSELSGLAPRDVRLAIAELNAKYLAAGMSFRIEEIARGFQMLTLPQFGPWLAKLNKAQAQNRLSGAALETLSIVAYKQPVIRADVEAIRGVSCGDVLTRLREMGLIRITGRAEIVGRPLLYGTTRKFLEVFGLADLDDLPPMESLSLRRAPAAPPAPEPSPAEPAAARGADTAPEFATPARPRPEAVETPVAAAGA